MAIPLLIIGTASDGASNVPIELTSVSQALDLLGGYVYERVSLLATTTAHTLSIVPGGSVSVFVEEGPELVSYPLFGIVQDGRSLLFEASGEDVDVVIRYPRMLASSTEAVASSRDLVCHYPFSDGILTIDGLSLSFYPDVFYGFGYISCMGIDTPVQDSSDEAITIALLNGLWGAGILAVRTATNTIKLCEGDSVTSSVVGLSVGESYSDLSAPTDICRAACEVLSTIGGSVHVLRVGGIVATATITSSGSAAAFTLTSDVAGELYNRCDISF